MSIFHRRGPQGFTLIELLAVVAVIAVLAAISIPAVMRARESSRRVQCSSNLREIGLALHLHHDMHRAFPSNGGWDGSQTIRSASGTQVTVSTTLAGSGKKLNWGVGDPSLPLAKQTGSWLFAILPYIEQKAMYDNRTWTVGLPTYICPSRREALAESVVLANEYGIYESGGWTWGKSDYASNAAVINGLAIAPLKRIRSIGSLSDGTSQTILIGEKAYNPSRQSATSWFHDEPFFLGGSGSTARRGVTVVQDQADNDFEKNWGAAHLGGTSFLFADGSVRPIAFGTDWQLMSSMLTPDSKDIVDVP